MKIIDAHSHFGIDNFWPNNGTLEEYLKYAKLIGISEVYAMPVSCPVIFNNHYRICPLIHGEYKENMDYFKIVSNNKYHYKIPINSNDNPYKLANDMMYNICKNTTSIKMNYIPLIHPYYYNIDDIINNITKDAKMFKIHGISMGIIPDKINNRFFKIIESCKIPLLIHTDYSLDDNLLSSNSAYNWYKILKKYDIKVYFAHAARLDKKVIDIVNHDNRYVLGIGPDRYLSCDNQNVITPLDYLDYCFTYINIDKIVFDLDYPWNIHSFDDMSLDWNSKSRIDSKLSETEKIKIYSKNINNFINKKN